MSTNKHIQEFLSSMKNIKPHAYGQPRINTHKNRVPYADEDNESVYVNTNDQKRRRSMSQLGQRGRVQQPENKTNFMTP